MVDGHTVGSASRGEHVVELVEGLEGTDEQQHEDGCRGGAQLRQGDVTQGLPPSGPVEGRSRIGARRNTIEPSYEQNHVVAHLQPQAQRDQSDPVPVALSAEPIDLIGAEPVQDGVDEPEPGAIEETQPPHHRRDDVRAGCRKKECRAEESPKPGDIVQRKGQRQGTEICQRDDEQGKDGEHQQ